MRVLYVASAIEASGTSGGATHVNEVACGLRDMGNDVLVVARPARSSPVQERLECGARLQTARWPKEMAILAYPSVRRAVATFRPDVVIERYYNFAGAGVLAAHRAGVPVLLEVNAPMVDPPSSTKSKLDRLLLGSMRRWAVKQAQWSRAIVTPLHTTVPPEVPPDKIHELPWGANVERFDPCVRETHRDELTALARRIGLAREGAVAAFLGSFRPWHGVSHFAEAARILLSRGSSLSFLAIGGGPELEPLKQRVAGWDLPAGRFVFAGAQPHALVANYLALADIGVAPFDLAAYAPLREFGFYWSPLKVFEYMSMAMPVVTIDVRPLNEIVRDGEEGLLYSSGDLGALVTALDTLAADPGMRVRMSSASREHVVARYSWRAHCMALDGILKQIAHAA